MTLERRLADGKMVAFDLPGREQAQAMLIENFH